MPWPIWAKTIPGVWANIAGTPAVLVDLFDLELHLKRPAPMTSSRGGGLKTPTAIDRRPVFLALGRCLQAWMDESIYACMIRCMHSFTYLPIYLFVQEEEVLLLG